jgi:RNA-directed DNA polymerase
MDSRSGEGPQYVWQPDLPLESTHKRRPARGHTEPEQHSRLQTELLEAIFSSTNLEAAYGRVKANDGAAGVDGISLAEFTAWFTPRREGLLRRLHLGNYRPSPVRRTHIAKKNGKKRPLGIPTVFDRIVQQAIHQALCPILDSRFSPHSYGFRPDCRGHDAVRRIHSLNKEGFRWSVDIDLKSFFDKVPQARALEALRGHLDGDGPVVRLIKRYLQAGYVELGAYRETPEGMPQGGPLSPLLSNLVLDALDKELEGRGHKFVRYADDFVVLVKSKRAAERVFASLVAFIEGKLGLEINREKSAVRPVRELNFLSFRFHAGKIKVSEESLAEFKYQLKELSNRNNSMSADYRMTKIRRYVRGWMGYFGLSEIYSIWLPIDRWLRRRIRMCYWRAWKKPKRRYLNMRKLGAEHKEAAGFARTSKGYWRVAKHLGYKAGMTNEWLANEGLIEIKQQWWNVKFLRITALKQTA